MQRRFEGMRRRQPVTQWGFLRPHKRQAEEELRMQEHLREHPALHKEYRRSLMLQLGVVGALTASCGVLVIESVRLLRHLSTANAFGTLAWVLPFFVGFLGLSACHASNGWGSFILRM